VVSALAPVHGRGATFIVVASSRPNSARRGATPLWTIWPVCDTPALIVGVHGVAPTSGDDLRAPHLGKTCARRGSHGRIRVVSSERYGLEPVARTTRTEGGVFIRVDFLPILLVRFRSLVEGGASASNQVTGSRESWQMLTHLDACASKYLYYRERAGQRQPPLLIQPRMHCETNFK